jgi:hypothetical protein
LLGPSSTWCAPIFSNHQAFSSSNPLALHDRHDEPPRKEICYINLLYLSLLNRQFSNNKDLWILLPVLLLLLLSSSVASERERTEENKQTKNRRKQMTIARLITKELTTPQLLLLLCALPRRILVEGAKAHLLLTCSINLTG